MKTKYWSFKEFIINSKLVNGSLYEDYQYTLWDLLEFFYQVPFIGFIGYIFLFIIIVFLGIIYKGFTHFH